MNWNRMAHAPIWICNEIVWYFKWWVCVIVLFGEWILDTGVKLIDIHDQFWEEIEQKVENWEEWNELD